VITSTCNPATCNFPHHCPNIPIHKLTNSTITHSRRATNAIRSRMFAMQIFARSHKATNAIRSRMFAMQTFARSHKATNAIRSRMFAMQIFARSHKATNAIRSRMFAMQKFARSHKATNAIRSRMFAMQTFHQFTIIPFFNSLTFPKPTHTNIPIYKFTNLQSSLASDLAFFTYPKN
jgi:hypothetical protein